MGSGDRREVGFNGGVGGVVQEGLEEGGSWRRAAGVRSGGRGRGAGASLGQRGARTLHGGVDVEHVRVRWNGLELLCNRHGVVSTYRLTRVPLF